MQSRGLIAFVAASVVAVAVPLSSDQTPDGIRAPLGYSIERYHSLAISPDGLHVAFEIKGLDRRLAVASTAEPSDVRALPNTDGASSPFWSPDGRFVAFFRHGQMQRVDLDGRLTSICACNGIHGTWGSRGLILFSARGDLRILAVHESGGKVWPVTTVNRSEGESSHHDPEFLPDGDQFVFAAFGTQRVGNAVQSVFHIFMASATRGQRPLLLVEGERPSILDAGTLLFGRGDDHYTMYIAPLTPSGEARILATNTPSFHANGHGAYVRIHESNSTEILAEDLEGHVQRIIASGERYSNARVSPDGKLVAYNEGLSVVVSEVSGKRVASFPAGRFGMTWSSDGRRIVAPLIVEGKCGIRIVEIATSAMTTISPACENLFDWSRDGRWVAIEAPDPHSPAFGFTFIPVENPGTSFTRQFVPKTRAGWLRFSPDGSEVAFDGMPAKTNFYWNSDELSVYRAAFEPDKVSEPARIVASGSYRPAWTSDGRDLLFVNAKGQLTRVSANTNGEEPKTLFALPLANPVFAEFEVSPHGDWFLVVREGHGIDYVNTVTAAR